MFTCRWNNLVALEFKGMMIGKHNKRFSTHHHHYHHHHHRQGARPHHAARTLPTLMTPPLTPHDFPHTQQAPIAPTAHQHSGTTEATREWQCGAAGRRAAANSAVSPRAPEAGEQVQTFLIILPTSTSGYLFCSHVAQ
ncbi:hypothetical protein E2C01_026184 [Portunus trituberculatus]|uniref:Uncharacterized protein n=1 Tax=Portunus trituberculatus TaxID=210409 RepID=A0A5B7EFD3_PORTR|nr:hypothetical protein [Portunus trituberculatus]